MNHVYVLGNLGHDIELRKTKTGNSVVNFNLAINKKKKNQLGEFETKTTWVRVVAWSKLADKMAQVGAKGKRVFVSGELESKKFVDKNGVEQETLEITANHAEVASQAQAEHYADHYGS